MATRYLEIEKDFSATKENPVTVHSWTVFLDRTGTRICCVSASRANFKKFWSFPFKPGKIGFYNGTEDAYCYFRGSAFQEFLDRYGIEKFVKEDPNGVIFRLRTAWYGGGDSSCDLITDGEIVYESSHDTDFGGQCFASTREVRVVGASYAFLVQNTWEGDRKSFGRTFYSLLSIEELQKVLPPDKEAWKQAGRGTKWL